MFKKIIKSQLRYMKTILKYILITLFCISRIKSECTGTDVTEEDCGASCKWTKTKEASCLGEDNGADQPQECNTLLTEQTCTGDCNWAETGTCADKTCTDYKTEDTCKAVSTCEWSNNACATKAAAATCTDYKTEDTCKAVSTCEWSNNACATKSGTTTTPTTDDDDDDGVFCLKSSILIFLLSFLF